MFILLITVVYIIYVYFFIAVQLVIDFSNLLLLLVYYMFTFLLPFGNKYSQSMFPNCKKFNLFLSLLENDVLFVQKTLF